MQNNAEVPLNDNEFNKFRKLIYSVAGISLSDRKRELVKSRLARRLRALSLDSYSDYYELLCDPKESGSELQNFTNCLTTNKTEFFRESHHFDYLRDKFFPTLRNATLSGREKKVRIWCAASSTGQEPYTLAMTLFDYFGPNSGWDMRILASDIDTQVLATATAGIYPEPDIDPIPVMSRQKYLTKISRGSDAQYQVKDDLKQLITFRQLNLNESPWPINVQFDAIFCRNVMIYFDQPTQQRLVERFAQYLLPDGLLVIGHSESLFSISDQFDSLGETIYRIKPGVSHSKNVPGDNAAPAASKPLAIKPLADQPHSAVRRTATTSSSVPKDTRSPGDRSLAKSARSSHGQTSQSAVMIDADTQLPSYPLIVGDYQASNKECILRTTLGSCVAACILDASNRIGGMNHFMLPHSAVDATVSASYGVHAMELLINSMLKLGANRRNLVAKVFGGAHVVDSIDRHQDIGSRNIEFVRRFLATENIPIVAEHLGGPLARQVRLNPVTGKVLVHLLDRRDTVDVEKEQLRAGSMVERETARQRPQAVTLF